MINWNDIDLKNKTKGKAKLLCPNCSESRKKKKEPCLSVDIDQGLAKCWNCEEVSVRDYKEVEKKYDLPNQEWRNYTNISDKLVNWFKSRGISQKTIIECKITEEKKYQPALQKEVNNLVFNYFDGNNLVNKKYRSGNKTFTQEKNAKKIFYGVNDIIGEDVCYIVEGEMDKLALWEIGIKNCISVPNGAKDSSNYFENCEQYLKGIKTFYIAVDMDEDGKNCEKDLIKRLGKHKCKRVNFKNKDANDDLKESALVLEGSLKNITDYPVDGTFTAKDIEEDIYYFYENGYDAPLRPNKNFKRFNEVFSPLRGQLVTVTGIPSHGKSNFIEWYCLNLISESNLKLSLYSPEHFPMAQHQSIFAQKFIGKPFLYDTSGVKRMSKKEVETFINWSKDKIYLTIPEKSSPPNWDWLFNKFEEQLYRYGIDVFIIDAWNKVKMKDGSLYEINDILSRLTLFCQMHGVVIFLIAHPTKMRKDEKSGQYILPTLYDVKGSGDFYDQSHCGLTVYRVFDSENEEGYTKVVTTKIKYNHQGQINSETIFKYDKPSGRFYEYNEPIQNFPMEEEKQEEIIYKGYDTEVGF